VTLPEIDAVDIVLLLWVTSLMTSLIILLGGLRRMRMPIIFVAIVVVRMGRTTIQIELHLNFLLFSNNI
jgi:hypothetical protein